MKDTANPLGGKTLDSYILPDLPVQMVLYRIQPAPFFFLFVLSSALLPPLLVSSSSYSWFHNSVKRLFFGYNNLVRLYSPIPGIIE